MDLLNLIPQIVFPANAKELTLLQTIEILLEASAKTTEEYFYLANICVGDIYSFCHRNECTKISFTKACLTELLAFMSECQVQSRW